MLLRWCLGPRSVCCNISFHRASDQNESLSPFKLKGPNSNKLSNLGFYVGTDPLANVPKQENNGNDSRATVTSALKQHDTIICPSHCMLYDRPKRRQSDPRMSQHSGKLLRSGTRLIWGLIEAPQEQEQPGCFQRGSATSTQKS